jgi:hypothetical protein
LKSCRLKRGRLAAWGCLFALAASPVAPAGEFAPVTVRLIQQFKSGSPETRFGALEFLGGIQYSSSDSRVGGVSAIRFRPDGRDFVAVLDTGHWMTGSLERNAEGRISALSQVSVVAMRAQAQNPSKLDVDAEGLAIRKNELLVSFERRHRVDAYPDPGFENALPRSVDMVIPRRELRANGGIETLAVSPANSPLSGAVIAVAERSVDEDGNLFAAVLDGPSKGIFKVVRNDPWAVTDGAFLPDGDLLLLERRFSYTGGVGMRIRRVAAGAIRPGALVDGKVLIEADMGAEIDNMEGLDVVQGPDGDIRIVIVSDDNRSFLQRNLMLEFRLAD